MDEILYNYLTSYYDILSKTGYMKDSSVYRLLVYSFYRDFMLKDYRGILTYKDYRMIEEVLDCMYGTDCLMSYPDYLKMGKLHLGEMTELATRTKHLEEYTSDIDARLLLNDEQTDDNTRRIGVCEERLDDPSTGLAKINERLGGHDSHLSEVDGRLNTAEGRLDTIYVANSSDPTDIASGTGILADHEGRINTAEGRITNHENRISTVEGTSVVKGKAQVRTITDIPVSSNT